MNVWDYKQAQLQQMPDYEKWRIERLLNYGMDGERIKKEDLKKYWNELKIPNETRELLQLIMEE